MCGHRGKLLADGGGQGDVWRGGRGGTEVNGAAVAALGAGIPSEHFWAAPTTPPPPNSEVGRLEEEGEGGEAGGDGPAQARGKGGGGASGG